MPDYKPSTDKERHKYGQRNFGLKGTRYRYGQFVYYQRLADEGHFDIYINSLDRLNEFCAKNADYSHTANFLFQAAEEEKKKELELLKKIFGPRLEQYFPSGIEGGFWNKNFSSELFKAMNYALGVKKIFERNIALITETKGQKDTFNYFGEYFLKTWKRHEKELGQQLAGVLSQAKELQEIAKGMGAHTAIHHVIKKKMQPYIKNMVEETIRDMFSKDINSGVKDKEKHKKDYEEIAKAFSSQTDYGNAFIESFIETYNLNDIIEDITQSFLETKGKNIKLSAEMMGKIMSQVEVRGGLTLEHFENYIVNYVATKVGSGGNDTVQYTMQATHSGSTGMKADNIITVGVDVSLVQNWLAKKGFGGREGRVRNVKKMKELQSKLASLNSGFIIYSSAKNSHINQQFSGRGGFALERSVSLSHLQGLFSTLDVKVSTLITSIMQLSKGAIGEGTDEEIKTVLARLVAASMFDDINEIGRHSISGVQSIHLLNLNGVYMPLSIYLNTLGNAFLKVAEMQASSESIKDWVRVDIKYPENILFPTQPEQDRWEELNKRSAWVYQRDFMINNTRVSYHFLKEFRQLVTDLISS